MESFAKKVNDSIAKRSTLDVSQGFEYVYPEPSRFQQKILSFNIYCYL